MSNGALIDLDDPTTWPAAAREWAQAWTDQSTSLDPIPAGMMDQEPELRASLAGHKLRAYHCTRLFEHEVAGIREHGLRQLTTNLIGDRIAAAHTAGAIDDDLRDRLSSKNALEWWNADSRVGKVCVVLGRETLNTEAHGVASFLEIWGGEGIYFAWDRSPTEDDLKQLGQPAIVVVLLDVTSAERAWCYSLGRPFVAQLRGEAPEGELHYKGDVPAADVLDVWQPGHPEYDRHAALPAR